MTIEDRLRAALHEQADKVVPTQPEWERIASRTATVHRRGARRWTAAGGLAAVAVAAAVIVVAVVSHHPSPTRLTTGGSPPTSAANPPTTLTPTTGPPSSTTAPMSTATALAGPPDGPVPSGFGPLSVTWVSISDGWVLGTARPNGISIVRTRDGGHTWHGIRTPSATGATGIRFADTSNGWLFGPDLWITHDGGSTWRQIADFGRVTSLETAAGTVYAVVGASLLASPVGTDAWRVVGAGVVAPGTPAVLHGRAGYTTASDGAVFLVNQDGTTKRRGSPCPNGPPSVMAAPTQTEVVAVCVSDPGAGSSTKTVMVSSDSAQTWSVAGTAPRGGQPDGLAAANPTTFVVGAASGASYLYRTTDAGRSWSTVYTDTVDGGSPFVDLGFTDKLHGVAVVGVPTGQSRLLATSDAGANWTVVRFAS